MKILILKPSSLGDVVQALPVLRLIKQHLPASEIYWWLDADLVPLLEGDPDLAGIIPFHRKRWRSPLRWPEAWRNLQAIRGLAFDWVIDLQSLARSGVVAWLANGGLTVGLDDPREGARGFYDVVASRASYHTHAADWYLSVLPLLGVPIHWNFDWLRARPAVAAAIHRKWPLEGARWILLQPGARWPNKRWPAEYFGELVRLFAGRNEFRFAILGSLSERDLGQAITSANPAQCLDLTGQTSLPEMIEWIRFCEVMVTNDSGPMHVAAALGKPIVAIFGPTEPRRTGPYGQIEQVMQLKLPCVPCLKDECAYERPLECLRAISPATIQARLAQQLSASSLLRRVE